MKGFGIEIKNDLLDPKHVEQMGVSVWLYMWLIDHITSVSEAGVGLVLGGKPVKFEEVKKELGISPDTYTRWIDKLAEYPYIKATRTPYGIVFQVLKAHKRFKNRIRESAESTSAEVRNPVRENAESNKTDTVRDSNSKTTPAQEVVNYYFELKGWANKGKEFYGKHNIVYGRFTKPAKELLDLCDGCSPFGVDREQILRAILDRATQHLLPELHQL
jgi:hypothetical protein